MSPKPKSLICIGAGGHGAEVVSYVCSMPSVYQLVGVIDDHRAKGPWHLSKVVGTLKALQALAKQHPGLKYITAIGDNQIRKRLVNEVSLLAETVVHPTAILGNSLSVGEGTLFGPLSVATARISIGKHCIVNVKASISHDVVIGDFVNINPGATVTGGCKIAEGAFIGAGATILPKVRIGRWAIVGAGAVVLSDVPDFATVVGVPAKIIRLDPKLSAV